jgi:hypothetical protein
MAHLRFPPERSCRSGVTTKAEMVLDERKEKRSSGERK